MQVESIKLKNIFPSEYNPRIISPEEQETLSKNLKEFGLVDPIIINLKNNHIIGGHQRYESLLDSEGGEKEYHLIKLGDIGWVFNEKKIEIKDINYEKALNLSLNKISGEWERNKLASVLTDLSKISFNMELTGFDELELKTFSLDDNIFFNEDVYELENIYDSPSLDGTEKHVHYLEEEKENGGNYPYSTDEEEFTLEPSRFIVEVQCSSEEHMNELYNSLHSKGYTCSKKVE